MTISGHGEPERNAGPSVGRWYVVYTQPNAESRAMFHLERQGYRIFCARIRKIVRHARRTTSVLSPLFPNYLFLNLDVSLEQWRSVNSTTGVVRLVMQGEAPLPILRGIVEALQSHMGDDGAMDWTPALKIGQPVRISGGPFADLIGTLEQLDAAGRVRVLLDLLGRTVSVALRYEALSPVAL
ncbi:MAG: transcriptional activator RfaH [Rhizomicrobium sp.]